MTIKESWTVEDKINVHEYQVSTEFCRLVISVCEAQIVLNTALSNFKSVAGNFQLKIVPVKDTPDNLTAIQERLTELYVCESNGECVVDDIKQLQQCRQQLEDKLRQPQSKPNPNTCNQQ